VSARRKLRAALVRCGRASDVKRLYGELLALASGDVADVRASDRIAAARLLLEYLVGKPDAGKPGQPGGSTPTPAGPTLVFRGPAVVQAAPIDGVGAVSAVQAAPIAELPSAASASGG